MTDVYGEDTTQQGTRGTTIKYRSERGTFGEALDQQIIKCLEETVNVNAGTGGVAQETNVVPDSAPIGCDKG